MWLIYGIWSLALEFGEFLMLKLEALAVEVCDLGCTLKATYAQQIMLISISNNAQETTYNISRICRLLSLTVCLKPRLVDELFG
jgi:hypothetical protein